LKDVKHNDVNPTENTLKTEADFTPGMQALVKTVRDTGAKNILVIGGLDWAYDLSGVANGFALDDLGGNGIIYVSHIYPWKSDWKNKVLVAADKYPIIITEVGCPRRWEDFSFIQPSQRYPLEGWSEDVLGLIQKHKLHWTGFSFHPQCGPQVILDWDYTPTPFWGVFVKEALQGRQFDMKAMR
jgi:endoglucanase